MPQSELYGRLLCMHVTMYTNSGSFGAVETRQKPLRVDFHGTGGTEQGTSCLLGNATVYKSISLTP